VYTRDVKLILESGQEISLDKTASGYFAGLIPGIRKAGAVKYRICASDGKGNTISSGEYSVNIMSNDIVLIDSENNEVVQANVEIIINGKEMISEDKPVIKNGRTLVPVRAISEALNAKVNWNGTTKTVTIEKNNKRISIKLGSKEAYAGKEKIKIDAPAVIVNDRTMLPLRSVCEMLGADISWDAANNRIQIS
jgi:hypothetical protein